jgi:hypothetical protein
MRSSDGTTMARTDPLGELPGIILMVRLSLLFPFPIVTRSTSHALCSLTPMLVFRCVLSMYIFLLLTSPSSYFEEIHSFMMPIHCSLLYYI